MGARQLAFTALLTLLPIAELRGGIPYAMANGMPAFAAFFYCVLLNAVVGPVTFLFLATAHRLLSHLRWYQRVFDRVLERARKKVHAKVERYGYLGLALFVAIPLPITGAYTGSLGAWVLGMDPRKTFLAVALGVVIAGIVVTVVSYLGIEALSFFIKKV